MKKAVIQAFQVISCTSALIAVMTLPSVGASVNEFPVPLRKTLSCMLNVLKTTPGVDEIDLSRADAPKGGFYASLAYRYSEETGAKVNMRFEINMHTDNGRVFYDFGTSLGGLATPGKEPDDYGTNNLIQKWKTQCGASAWVLYM